MSGIFGLINLDGAPVDPAHLEAMHQAMAHWGPDGGGVWRDGCAGLGQCLLFNTPEAVHERLPYASDDGRLAFTAEARIDNREDLFESLGVHNSERVEMPDGELILRAYERWGEACADRLIGDWSFAAWHRRERRLLLARDHYGKTAVYIYADAKRFAFASDRRALLVLPAVSRCLNELHLAQIIVAWPGVHGRSTVFSAIERLPPAHALCLADGRVRIFQYWNLDDVPEVHLGSPAAYAEGLLDVLSQAVRCRLRSYRPVGIALSAGLDSTTVAAIASRELRDSATVLPALTAVPLFDVTQSTPPTHIGNEWDLSEDVVKYAGNLSHRPVTSETVSPIAGIRFMLDVHGEPNRGAITYYWHAALSAEVRRLGVGTLLDGMSGNGAMPSSGTFSSWRHLLAKAIPASLKLRRRLWRRHRRLSLPDREWFDSSAIHRDFAKRVGLVDRMREAGYRLGLPPRAQTDRQAREWTLRSGQSNLGANSAEWAAHSGAEFRDPFGDRRVLSYAFGVPEDAARGPLGRWLVREAMRGYMPDSVRLNARRGLQCADIVDRLRAHQHETDSALAQLRSDAAAKEYLDLSRMTAVGQRLRTDDSQDVRAAAEGILLRGCGVGLFLRGR